MTKNIRHNYTTIESWSFPVTVCNSLPESLGPDVLLPRLREYQVEPVERHPVDVPLPLRPAPPHEAVQLVG